MEKNYEKQILERIESSEKGSLFIISDFSDIADTEMIKQALFRLTDKKKIRRVVQGVYEYPEYKSFFSLEHIKDPEKGSMFITSDLSEIDIDTIDKALLKLSEIRKAIREGCEYPDYSSLLVEYVEPSPDKVAHALARNYGWTIIPTDDTALYKLGLSTQIPEQWTYISDGPYKKYELDKVVLKFKSTVNKDFLKVSYKTAMLIQAIRAIGKNNITKDTIREISEKLSSEEKNNLLLEAKYTNPWIYFVLKKIGYMNENMDKPS